MHDTVIFRIFLLASFILTMSPQAFAARCLFVNSYHPGYEWSDGIERGLEKVLAGKCEIDKFYMDTKRIPDKAFAEEMGLKAKEHIETTKPDVVIAADDAASLYLVKPYYKDAAVPIVFCGVNQSVEAYGYPYTNVTGMVEIAPVEPLMNAVKATIKDVTSGIYLMVDTLSQYKEYDLNKDTYSKGGIQLDRILVKNMDEWEKGFLEAQSAPFVVVGSNGGLEGWDDARAKEFVLGNTKTLTVTNMDWMIAYSVLAMTKVSEEQGEWAAEAALAILEGAKPTDIPIIVNRQWNILVNSKILEKTSIQLPDHIMQKAVRFE